MSQSVPPDPPSKNGSAVSPWVHSLVEFLKREDQVEALRVNPEKGTVSVATLGSVDHPALQRRLEAVLESMDREHLLEGNVGSESDAADLAGSYGMHLSRDSGKATLEKPSCPTSPHL